MDAEVFDGEDIRRRGVRLGSAGPGNGWRIRPVGAWFDRRAGGAAGTLGLRRRSEVIDDDVIAGTQPALVRAASLGSSSTSEQSGAPWVALARCGGETGQRATGPS